uniref:Uncharacterized protein n=1 Tax=Rhizophora mucronata TaxID=61149 RepID=A0A2P2NWA3_RHIMU
MEYLVIIHNHKQDGCNGSCSGIYGSYS